MRLVDLLLLFVTQLTSKDLAQRLRGIYPLSTSADR